MPICRAADTLLDADDIFAAFTAPSPPPRLRCFAISSRHAMPSPDIDAAAAIAFALPFAATPLFMPLACCRYRCHRARHTTVFHVAMPFIAAGARFSIIDVHNAHDAMAILEYICCRRVCFRLISLLAAVIACRLPAATITVAFHVSLLPCLR